MTDPTKWASLKKPCNACPFLTTAVQVWHVWWTSDGQRFLHATYRNHADALTRARGLRRHGFTTQIKEQSQ